MESDEDFFSDVDASTMLEVVTSSERQRDMQDQQKITTSSSYQNSVIESSSRSEAPNRVEVIENISDDDDDEFSDVEMLAAVEAIESKYHSMKNSDNADANTWTCTRYSKRAEWQKSFREHWSNQLELPPLTQKSPLRIDEDAMREYVYPTNMQVREYQLAAVKAALFSNTLVVLPTGLGKTFIAAVVMYNFYRWFPTGKIVFMAPTKPLVEQQVEACYNIVGIPPEDTAELQGRIKPADRIQFWRKRRVFFCTPQTFQNDLKKGKCDSVVNRFVCIVVDEAHKATGKYAYCNVVRYIRERNPWFRVLALSATPGKQLTQVQDVCNNLLISKIVARSDSDPDVRKYKHTRLEDVVKVKLPPAFHNLEKLFLETMNKPLQYLRKMRVLGSCTPSSVTAMKIINARNNLKVRLPNGVPPSHRGKIMGVLSLLQNLVGAKKMLRNYGLRSFYDCIQQLVRKARDGDTIRKSLVSLPTFCNLRRTLANMVERGTLVHPKLAKTVDILRDHFERAHSNERQTSAIVFVQFRAAVAEIVKRLKRYEPAIKARAFVGQSSGAGMKSRRSKKQKGRSNTRFDDVIAASPDDFADCVAMRGQNQAQQKQAIEDFRAGHFNTLVATCIAEEGLDIGAVDLIISFDALTSPIRMVQRRGRTGRKRAGRSVVLLTEGIDERKYRESNRLAGKLMAQLKFSEETLFMRPSLRLVPERIDPELVKREMVFSQFHSSQVGGRGGPSASDREKLRKRKRILESGLLTHSQTKLLDPYVIDSDNDKKREMLRVLASPYIESREWAKETYMNNDQLKTKRVDGPRVRREARPPRLRRAKRKESACRDSSNAVGTHSQRCVEATMKKKKLSRRKERRLRQKERERQLVAQGLLILDAECSDDDDANDDGNENDDDDLDRNLSGFINDSTPDRSDTDLSQASTHDKYWRSVVDSPIRRPRQDRRRSRRDLSKMAVCRAALQTIDDTRIHRGYRCDACGIGPIQGLRFHCQTCGDVDFCEACALNSEVATTHEAHTMLKYSQVVSDSQPSSEEDDDLLGVLTAPSTSPEIPKLQIGMRISLQFNDGRWFAVVTRVAPARIHVTYDADGSVEKIERADLPSRDVRVEGKRGDRVSSRSDPRQPL
eukprot:g3025.t1